MDRLTRDGVAHGGLSSDGNATNDRWDNGGESHRAGDRSDAAQAAEDRMRWLTRTIEADIIPRLMLAHCATRETPGPERPGVSHTPPGASEVEAFAQMALDESPSASAAYVESLRAEGMALDVIYMELLAPAARRLGELWEADLCDFTQVTLGLWRIQQVMYDLSPAFHRATGQNPVSLRALLAPAPKSQHTFGLLMVSEFFRRAGWDVSARTSVTASELIEAATSEWFDLFGISVSGDCQIEMLTSVILKVRAISRNPAIFVMVGGPIVIANPEVVTLVGADGTALDAVQAVVEAERMVAHRNRLS